jgi:hypothetical protein
VVGSAGRPARQRTQHDYHHDTKVKPEAATAVFELLMMGGETPETCWAVNKHQNNKPENCCIWLVIYLNCTMMHGLTNLKDIPYVMFISVVTSCKMEIVFESSACESGLLISVKIMFLLTQSTEPLFFLRSVLYCYSILCLEPDGMWKRSQSCLVDDSYVEICKYWTYLECGFSSLLILGSMEMVLVERLCWSAFWHVVAAGWME